MALETSLLLAVLGGGFCRKFGIPVSSTAQALKLLGRTFFGDRKYVIDSEKMLIRFAR